MENGSLGVCPRASRSQQPTSLTARAAYPVSSSTSRSTATEGVSSGSAQPPGNDHKPSLRSRISSNRSRSSTSAPRTSTFGVAYPESAPNCCRQLLVPVDVVLVARVVQPALRERGERDGGAAHRLRRTDRYGIRRGSVIRSGHRHRRILHTPRP